MATIKTATATVILNQFSIKNFFIKHKAPSQRYRPSHYTPLFRQLRDETSFVFKHKISDTVAIHENLADRNTIQYYFNMPFTKGHQKIGGRAKGCLNKETLTKIERRAYFDKRAQEKFDEWIDFCRPEYGLDQFIGKAGEKLDITTKGEQITMPRSPEEEKRWQELKDQFHVFIKQYHARPSREISQTNSGSESGS